MTIKKRYQLVTSIQSKAKEALGMEGMAVCIRDRIQANCQILHKKTVIPTRVVGFLMHLRRTPNNTGWTGKLAIRLNNKNLNKNPLRYNFSHVLKHSYISSYYEPYFGEQVESSKIYNKWYSMSQAIKNYGGRGIIDFLNCPYQAYRIAINSIHWPNLYYDELFSMIDNNSKRKDSFDFVWEDEEQITIDHDMAITISRLNNEYKSC